MHMLLFRSGHLRQVERFSVQRTLHVHMVPAARIYVTAVEINEIQNIYTQSTRAHFRRNLVNIQMEKLFYGF